MWKSRAVQEKWRRSKLVKCLLRRLKTSVVNETNKKTSRKYWSLHKYTLCLRISWTQWNWPTLSSNDSNRSLPGEYRTKTAVLGTSKFLHEAAVLLRYQLKGTVSRDHETDIFWKFKQFNHYFLCVLRLFPLPYTILNFFISKEQDKDFDLYFFNKATQNC